MQAPLHDRDTQISTESLRILLQEELIHRIEKNPKYSLRAFAKALGIQPPSLSHILKGSRRIPKKESDKILAALELSPQKLQERFGSTQNTESSRYSQYSIDIFNVIADWYHFAILELVRLSNFKPDPKWIAKCLNISTNEVNAAVERLERVGMLKVGPKGIWKLVATHSTTTGNSFTSAALKKVQKQYLQKASEALDEITIERRDQSGMTVAVGTNDIPDIKERIKRFRRDLTKFIEANKKPDEVYQITISFFPLTRNKEML